MKPSWYMDPLDSVFPPTNDDQSPLMSWADYGPREIHSAVASAVTLVSQSYMTYFSDAQPMSILWFVCVSFWGICLHFFFSFCLYCLQKDCCSFSFSLSVCVECSTFTCACSYRTQFSPLINRPYWKDEKKRDIHPSSRSKKKEKKNTDSPVSLLFTKLQRTFTPTWKIHTMPQYGHLLLRLLPA